MEKKKQTYEAPDIQETRVELESSICSGSVDFGKDKTITIESQEFTEMHNNDFSEKEWVINNGTTD